MFGSMSSMMSFLAGKANSFRAEIASSADILIGLRRLSFLFREKVNVKSLNAEIVEVEIEVVSPSIVPSGNFAVLNRTVTCMVLKANDRRTSCPCHDEFRGPQSDYVRQTRRVAGQVDRSECAIRNCWEQCTGEGTHARKTVSGASRKTTRIEDRRIVRQALVDPTVTRSTIRTDVGVAIVKQTISRHLAEANLNFKRPFRALPLEPEHRQLRLQWCQARSM
ncbi:HTH_Tnp_Tc3_2 domain-containing protein [Trichonephila clavipes]|nr:HTH_Tnp_Tc3_2 domain-containing protein [Trichonephila clavipes]